jgi:hypothetical protein
MLPPFWIFDGSLLLSGYTVNYLKTIHYLTFFIDITIYKALWIPVTWDQQALNIPHTSIIPYLCLYLPFSSCSPENSSFQIKRNHLSQESSYHVVSSSCFTTIIILYFYTVVTFLKLCYRLDVHPPPTRNNSKLRSMRTAEMTYSFSA